MLCQNIAGQNTAVTLNDKKTACQNIAVKLPQCHIAALLT